MGIEIKEKGSEWPQILAVLLCSLASTTCGILFAWCSPSIPKLLDETDITLEQASYLTVIPPLTAVLSAFPCSKIVDKIGRKYAVLAVAIPQIISWTLIAIGDSIWIYYASRIFAGIGDAGVFSAVPIYIAEVTTPKVRGTWGNAMTFLLFGGSFIVNLIGAYYSIRETAFILVTIPILLLVTFSFMPETPYYCIMKNRHKEGKAALQWLRRKEDVEEEFKQISEDIKRQLSESGKLKDLFCIKSNRKAVIIGAVSRTTQQYSGISSFVVYSQHLFKVSGGDLSASTSAIICSVSLMIFCILASVVLDLLGRRRALFLSGIGCDILLVLMGTFLYLHANTTIDLSPILWFPVVGMIAFIILFSLGLGVVPNLMLGELFSSSIKGYALALMNIVFGLLIASSTKLFQLLLSNFGLYMPFFFYASVTFICLLICYFIVPETKGKTLAQIQSELKGKSKSKVTTSDIEQHM